MTDINDFTFFAAIDDLVRDSMKEFEARLLSTLQHAVKDTKVPVVDVPLEGYYSETPELKEALRNLRALQNNYSDVVTGPVQKLHAIYCERDTFGLGPSKETALNKGKGLLIPATCEPERAVISPMMDTLGLAVQNIVYNEGHQALDMQRIMAEAEKMDKGHHLVGLAVFVDSQYMQKDENGRYNPVATAMGAESTVGSRSVMMSCGISEPELSDEVLEMGMNLIGSYNNLFASFREGDGIKISTKKKDILNRIDLVDFVGMIGRCVRLAEDRTAVIPVIYHWALVSDMGIPDNKRKGPPSQYELGLRVVEVKNNHVITTDEFRPHAFKYLHK